ncbi:SRPBCC family protein [Sphingomonas sp.]|uniref:SRPBCC family protein n=1 Tax=Sphingomonas sp. TaxID=28214 RepID=UPI00286E323D|nr:SRPBCC family protein [Sphingomonas sp.]
MNPDTDLRIERTLDAPRELVWRAWTDPEQIKKWWAPRPYQTPECEIELTPGGKFMTRMTGPDGMDFTGNACILEVVEGERITWSSALLPGFRPNSFPDDGCGGFPFTAIHTFADAGGGKTHYTATVLHKNAADAKIHADMGFQDGWGTCAEQLGEVARGLVSERA